MGTLKRLRVQLGFTPDEVTTVAGWTRAHLNEIETSDNLDESEADRLSDLYGVDLEQILTSPHQVATRQPVAALLKAQAEILDAGSRFAIAEATSVARTVRQLQAHLMETPKWDAIRKFASNTNYAHPSDGLPERLANNVRSRLNLSSKPILSIPTQVFRQLGIILLWEDLPSHIDAFSLATPETGATIVLNIAGEHTQTGFGRRVVWAHELCHLLFDRSKMRSLGKFCAIAGSEKEKGKTLTQGYQIERRARAFAAWFLAPRNALVSAWNESSAAPPNKRVRRVMTQFGLGYEATRGQLSNAELLGLDVEISPVHTDTPHGWEKSNPPAALNQIARQAGVSPLRAGALLDLLIRAHDKGLVSDAFVREQLRVGIGGWEKVRVLFKNAMGGTWSTSVAVLSESA